jgi:hypothetical protein
MQPIARYSTHTETGPTKVRRKQCFMEIVVSGGTEDDGVFTKVQESLLPTPGKLFSYCVKNMYFLENGNFEVCRIAKGTVLLLDVVHGQYQGMQIRMKANELLFAEKSNCLYGEGGMAGGRIIGFKEGAVLCPLDSNGMSVLLHHETRFVQKSLSGVLERSAEQMYFGIEMPGYLILEYHRVLTWLLFDFNCLVCSGGLSLEIECSISLVTVNRIPWILVHRGVVPLRDVHVTLRQDGNVDLLFEYCALQSSTSMELE